MAYPIYILALLTYYLTKVGATSSSSTACAADNVQLLQTHVNIGGSVENDKAKGGPAEGVGDMSELTEAASAVLGAKGSGEEVDLAWRMRHVEPSPTSNKLHTTHYSATDKLWLPQSSDEKMPRVLMYTWCTDNALKDYYNEAYWKSCYAHAHGFDVVFSSSKNFTDLRSNSTDFSVSWYSEDNMFGWVNDIRNYLFSGKYDYVFVTGADVLLNQKNLWFPVWAYDRGHSITVMDQDFVDYGFNENGMLFKPTQVSHDFLNELFEYRKGFYMQGDNGPYMDLLLKYVGRDAEKRGSAGYDQKCTEYLKLDKPSSYLATRDKDSQDFKDYADRMRSFSTCFFSELTRLAGDFNSRRSESIGFVPIYLNAKGQDTRLPDADPESPIKFPWANCFLYIRNNWPNWQDNCFTLHWNGPKYGDEVSKRKGTCPDPSFNFESKPYKLVGLEDVFPSLIKDNEPVDPGAPENWNRESWVMKFG